MNLTFLPLIVIFALLPLFLAVKAIIVSRRETKKKGKLRKLNIAFKLLCCIGGLIDFLIVILITQGDIEPLHPIALLAILIIPGIITQCIYFLPYLIANSKGHEQETAIFILNLFAGWTFIAWVIALVWAFTNKASIPKTPQQPLSNADEIAKYKSLLDSGIITEEEFEAKKSELLNSQNSFIAGQ